MEPTTIIGLIGTILTVVVGPLLALWIKNYLQAKADAAEQARQDDLAEAIVRKKNQEAVDKAKSINDSIEKQKKNRKDWGK